MGAISTIKALLNRRVVDLERYDNNLNTPLHLACMKSSIEAKQILELLFMNPTSSSIINAKNEDGM